MLFKKTLFLLLLPVFANAQDSLSERFSIHGQATVINQYKPEFTAPYTGSNSLTTGEESQTSITSTLFLGAKLWKGASIFINPEIAGGSGLSSTLGIAAAPNGETFRVGSPKPQIYMARFFLQQTFALGEEKEYVQSTFNTFAASVPKKYFRVSLGKICMTDFFDNNTYSHDPREHFMSWALMTNGAWDYPANTRGYTIGTVLEYVSEKHEIRYAASMVPLLANGPDLNTDISKASSHTLEYTYNYKLGNRVGAIRLLSFFTTANMGNYNQSVALNPFAPSIENTREYGRSKYGFGINIEQEINDYIGGFFRASWNDGNNETWAFTEIDRSASLGLEANGKKWKRENDHIGIAYVICGISTPHQNYLKAGGHGFMLGDGNLIYAPEHLGEFFYSFAMSEQIFLSGAYQLLINPGYNADRSGPINIFSLRLHMAM